MSQLTVAFGVRDDIVDLAETGEVWVEDNDHNRAQVRVVWDGGGAATLFAPKDLWAVLEDADLHYPNWSELRVLRA